MNHIAAIADAFWSARTPFVVLAFFVIGALAQRSKNVERYHTRAAGTMITLHVVAIGIAGLQSAFDYESTIAETVGLAFSLLATVSLGVTLVFRVVLPRVGITLPRILLDILTAICTIVVFIIVGKRAGFSVAGLITTSAVLTAVIGFSLQDTLGSMMGGLSLQMDKSVSVGDWISLGPNQPVGRVVEIRWRYTAIETRNWETIIIPNNQLVKSQVIILGRRTGEATLLRRHVEFFVDFRTSPTDVIDACEAALKADPVPCMSATPPPHVIFFGVKDSYGVYAARYWLQDLSADDGTDSAVRIRLWFALRRAGIQLSIPASTVFLTQESKERDERKDSEERERRLAALAKVDLLSGLLPSMIQELANELQFKPFAAGEKVTREGDRDDGLYMLVKGDAAVRIGKGADEKEVARLTAGQFFGEMSLMTGEARTATVVATTDLVTYRIDKPAFEKVLRETPAVAEQIAHILVERRTVLSAAQHERDEVRNKRIETARHDLASKIRGFFGIDRSH
ncbi:MAG: cyclic nucleotide-binding domain-containing protein [Kofleriaceae bacterium]